MDVLPAGVPLRPQLDVTRVRIVRAQDPAWLRLAEAAGWRVERGSAGYVWTDGRGTLGVAEDEGWDGDDTWAQLLLHEWCHFLTEGWRARWCADWGLDNLSDSDAWRERAALRLQAYVTARWGLEEVLAPTTDFWLDYQALREAPLEAVGRHPETAAAERLLAHEALTRWWAWGWRPSVEERLRVLAADLRG